VLRNSMRPSAVTERIGWRGEQQGARDGGRNHVRIYILCGERDKIVVVHEPPMKKPYFLTLAADRSCFRAKSGQARFERLLAGAVE
jgi:hypothetical protein